MNVFVGTALFLIGTALFLKIALVFDMETAFSHSPNRFIF